MIPIGLVRDTQAALEKRGFTTKLTVLPGHSHAFVARGKEVVEKAWEFLSKARLTTDPVFQPYKFR